MQKCRGKRGKSTRTLSGKVSEITGTSDGMFQEICYREDSEGKEPKNLHTDVFWLLSLLGMSFTPLDFSSICFLTAGIGDKGKGLAELQGF